MTFRITILTIIVKLVRKYTIMTYYYSKKNTYYNKIKHRLKYNRYKKMQ